MALTAGSHLGPYQVTAQIGSGGMGEVYKARDTRLKREVALKILPAEFVADAERLARFDREARTLAALNHPHIAQLLGVEEQAGTRALVMELVEGETLAERIARGPIPRDEALPIARQIAEALETAHEQGIIHRDLKPANVKVRPDGTVKVLDFGLAKALEPVSAGGVDATASPTITSPALMTGTGVLLGTAAYMSPEQARGRTVDKRSDIWAFSCVLYEMLTGRPAFGGGGVTEVLARVLERDPDWSALPHGLPPSIRRLLRRGLEKDRRRRLSDIADARLEIDEALSGRESDGAAAVQPAAPRRISIPAALILAFGVAIAGVSAAAWRYTVAGRGAEETRFEVAPPPGTMWAPSPVASTAQLVLSPDGRRLAFIAAARRGVPQIWIRALASIQAQPLPGTDGASFPFWSPDNRSIGFFADGKLKKIDTNGGTPQVLANAPLGRGGSWNRDDVIIFTPAPPSGIWRVSAAGGPATNMTTVGPDSAATNHVWPQFLSDGRRFIFYQRSNTPENQGIFLSELGSTATSQILRNDGMGVLAGGHLFVVRDGTLFAQPIDEATMQLRGDPVRVADHVGFTLGTIGYSPLSAAGATVAYGPSVRLLTALQWRDRSGMPVGPVIARGVYRSPRLSNDGRQVVLTVLDEQANSPDIWTFELARGTFARVTSDPATDWFPVWAQDGDRVFFGSARTRATSLFQRHITGNAPEEALATPEYARYPLDVTSDGHLLFQEGRADGYDLAMLNLAEKGTSTPLLATPFSEVQGRVAPNNRWVAYASDESGRFEVYVRGLAAGGRQWTISPGGGMQPEWRHDGRELFYISRDRKLMAVPVTTDGETFSAGVPTPLFDVDMPEPNAPYPNDYAASADGKRFLVNTLVDQPSGPSLAVVLNWGKPGR